MRIAAIASTLLLLSGSAHAAKPVVSWGKAGVEFERYRLDSIECGKQGAGRDMSKRLEYGQVMHGLQAQNSILDGPNGSIDDGTGHIGSGAIDYVMVQRRTMQRQVPALQHYLVNGVERCLISRGYTAFTLTNEQTKVLAKLARGSDARFHYLHSLAADPRVLAAQGVDTPR